MLKPSALPPLTLSYPSTPTLSLPHPGSSSSIKVSPLPLQRSPFLSVPHIPAHANGGAAAKMKSMKKALNANKVIGSLKKRASGASILIHCCRVNLADRGVQVCRKRDQ